MKAVPSAPGHEASKPPDGISPDSAPPGYAVTRRGWTAGSFLFAVGALSTLTVPALPTLESIYGQLLGTVGGTTSSASQGGWFSIRPFFLSVLLALSIFAAGSLGQRLKLLAFTWAAYLGALVAIDLILVRVGAGTAPFSEGGGVIAALTGLVVTTVGIFRFYSLPSGVRVPRRRPRSTKSVVLLVGIAALSATAAPALSGVGRLPSGSMGFQAVPVGGSVTALSILTMMTMLWAVASLRGRRRPSLGAPPSVAFIVPALNEREGIGECIRALDRAAGRYDGQSKLYLVDNGSTDGTAEAATGALDACRALSGRLLHHPHRGKSRALNHGLRHAGEDLVIRVDADTLVPADILPSLVPRFVDPAVGGVTGLPLPTDPTSWIGRIRTIEVHFNIAFLRVAHSAVDAVTVMPGVMAGYRRSLLVELGGFAEGINGEDADMTVRIGRLGYSIVVDPLIRPRTQVPSTVGRLAEQRRRWARGLYHMAARNMSMIWMRQGPRGVLLLPWAVLNSCRNWLTLPILLWAALVLPLGGSAPSLRQVTLVGGWFLGIQVLVLTVVLIGHRQFGVIPFIPAYLGFQLFLAYVALDALLTLRLGHRPDQAFGRPGK